MLRGVLTETRELLLQQHSQFVPKRWSESGVTDGVALPPPRVHAQKKDEKERLMTTVGNFMGPYPSDQLLETFSSVSADATGQNIVATASTSVYLSNDFGANFNRSNNLAANNYFSSAIAVDAPQYVVVGSYGAVLTSSNYGSTFTSSSANIAGSWVGIALSANGSVGYAVTTVSTNIYGSMNNQLSSFTPLANSPVIAYYDIATTETGETAMAVNYNGYYLTTDFGNTWTLKTIHIGSNLVCGKRITTSGSGQYIAIVAASANIFVSNNYGQSFFIPSGFSNVRFTGVSMSSSGQYMNIVASSYSVYSSANFGKSFYQSSSGSEQWSAVSTSSTGESVFATCAQGYLFRSLDFSSTWSPLFYDWVSVASSVDGSRRIAVTGYTFNTLVYMTSDGGNSWQSVSGLPSYQWTSVSCDSDCQHIAITSLYYGNVFISDDSGATWTKKVLNIPTTSVVQDSAWSENGQYLALCVNNGYIYTSSNYGSSFTKQVGSQVTNCWSIASSADGHQLVAVASNYVYFGPASSTGLIMISTDYGVTWQTQADYNGYYWFSVSSDLSGEHLIAVSAYDGPVVMSNNSGQSWFQPTVPTGRNWVASASSSDGSVLYIANGGGSGSTMSVGQISVSVDGGLTWTETNSATTEWQGLACDSTGQYVTAVAFLGQVYTSSNFGEVWVPQNITATAIPYSGDDDSDGSDSSALSAGAIAGIVVGGVALLIAIGVVVAVFAFGVTLPCFRKTPMAELSEPLSK